MKQVIIRISLFNIFIIITAYIFYLIGQYIDPILLFIKQLNNMHLVALLNIIFITVLVSFILFYMCLWLYIYEKLCEKNIIEDDDTGWVD